MIMVHGMVNGLGWVGRLHRRVDWTDGCIAVTNGEMDEIWRAVPVRTPHRYPAVTLYAAPPR
jgi:murein L,D-transpeptidase YafK